MGLNSHVPFFGRAFDRQASHLSVCSLLHPTELASITAIPSDGRLPASALQRVHRSFPIREIAARK